MNRNLITSVACLTLGAAGGAYAQTGEPSPDEDSTMALSTVTVTAERGQGQDLQDTSVAVTALPASEMEDRGVQNVRDLANLVPSLQFGSQTNGPGGTSATFWIRGLGQERSGNGSEPSVPLYIDDFYYPSIAGNILRAMDIEQVEVLRGPQGTLFGRNSIGGAVRYQTKRPEPELGGFFEGTVGSHDRQDLIGAINVPLTDDLAIRVTGADFETGGFAESLNGGDKGGATENDLVRAQMRYTPSDALTIDLSHQIAENKAFGTTSFNSEITPFAPLAARWNVNPANTPTFDTSLLPDCFGCVYGNLPVDEYSEAITHNTHLVADWFASDNLELKFMAGRSIVKEDWVNDVDGTPAAVGLQYSTTRVEANSYEVQALGDLASWLHYVVGVYYYEEEGRSSGGQQAPGPTGLIGTSEVRSLRDRTSTSGYGNFRIDLSDRLTATLGVRVGKEEASITSQSLVPTTALSDGGSFEEDVVLPLAKLQYDWSEDIMTYVSYSQGYRAGGYNIVPANAAVIPFKAEDVNSYEVGARMEFLGGRARINPTVFYSDYSGMQINSQYFPEPPAPPVPTSILQNAGEATIYGAELESVFVITPELSINLAASHLEGEYDAVNPEADVTIDSPLPRLPDLFYAVGARYERPITADYELSANLDWSWRSEQYNSGAVGRVLVEEYGLLNGQIGLANIDDGWSISLFGTNLLDKEYITGGVELLSLVGNVRLNQGRPREIGIRLRGEF